MAREKVKKEDYACVMPFTYMAPFQDRVDACCSDWCDVSVPYIKGKTTLEECWNSKEFKEFRAEVLGGNYKHCNDRCPFLRELEISGNKLGMFLDKEKARDVYGREASLAHIKFCSDETCNLHCKTCRREVIITKDSPLIYQFKDLEDSSLSKSIEILDLLGSGELFVSKACLDWLKNFDRSKYPKLEQIHIHTNAQAFTLEKVDKVKDLIKSVEISIDAATKETYEKIRRGGNWGRLKLRIHEMLTSLTACNEYTLSFVIQKWNVSEIQKFYEHWVKFIRSVKPKVRIIFRFSPAEQWGISNEDYEENVNIRNNAKELQLAISQINQLRKIEQDNIFVESSL